MNCIHVHNYTCTNQFYYPLALAHHLLMVGNLNSPNRLLYLWKMWEKFVYQCHKRETTTYVVYTCTCTIITMVCTVSLFPFQRRWWCTWFNGRHSRTEWVSYRDIWRSINTFWYKSRYWWCKPTRHITHNVYMYVG